MKLGVCVRVYQYMCVCVCDVCGLVYVCVYHVLQYTKIKKVGIILISSKDVSLIPPT